MSRELKKKKKQPQKTPQTKNPGKDENMLQSLSQQPSPMSSIPIYIKGAPTLLSQLTLCSFSHFGWKNDWQKQSRSVCHLPSFWFSCELKAMGDFHSWPSIIASWNVNPQLTVMGQSSNWRRQLCFPLFLVLLYFIFFYTISCIY